MVLNVELHCATFCSTIWCYYHSLTNLYTYLNAARWVMGLKEDSQTLVVKARCFALCSSRHLPARTKLSRIIGCNEDERNQAWGYLKISARNCFAERHYANYLYDPLNSTSLSSLDRNIYSFFWIKVVMTHNNRCTFSLESLQNPNIMVKHYPEQHYRNLPNALQHLTQATIYEYSMWHTHIQVAMKCTCVSGSLLVNWP